MNTIIKYALPVAAFAFAALVGYFLMGQANPAFASAPSGLPASVISQTAFTVTNAASQIAATSTCAARTVSTSASPIMLGFTAKVGTTTTGSFGFLQAASTTVTYDSGQFGCDQMSAFSYTSGTITVIETR